MKIILCIFLAVYVASAYGDEHCDCPVEMGDCGCCPPPCCCKCVQDCEECPCLKLGFMIDGSGSIGSLDWTEQLIFVETVVNTIVAGFDANGCAGLEYVNVGVVTFGNNATVAIPMQMAQTGAPMIPNVFQPKKATNIVEGMELAIDQFFSGNDDCFEFGIIVTDGRSNFRKAEIPAMGAQLRAATDDLVCIGITSEIDQSQLDNICEANRQQNPNDFDDLVALINDVVGVVEGNMGSCEKDCFCCCPPPVRRYY